MSPKGTKITRHAPIGSRFQQCDNTYGPESERSHEEGEKDDEKSSGEEAQDSEFGAKERGTDPGTTTDDQIDDEFRKESHNDEMNFEGTRTRRQEERRDVQLMSRNLKIPTVFKK